MSVASRIANLFSQNQPAQLSLTDDSTIGAQRKSRNDDEAVHPTFRSRSLQGFEAMEEEEEENRRPPYWHVRLTFPNTYYLYLTAY